MSIERRLRNIREERGVSQEALAERLKVSRQTVSKWETGQVRPSADNLARLSQALGVPVDALVKDGWTPPEPEIQIVEVPVETPVPRFGNYRLWAVIAAVVLAAGILLGALFFRERREESVPEATLEGEVINSLMIGETMPMLPLE